ncbi:MAG: hypothetical protein ACNA8W_15550 [Bradymonadaceae bacterium]
MSCVRICAPSFPLHRSREPKTAKTVTNPKKAPTLRLIPPVQAVPLAGVDLNEIALERARKRGEHLVKARYACAEQPTP